MKLADWVGARLVLRTVSLAALTLVAPTSSTSPAHHTTPHHTRHSALRPSAAPRHAGSSLVTGRGHAGPSPAASEQLAVQTSRLQRPPISMLSPTRDSRASLHWDPPGLCREPLQHCTNTTCQSSPTLPLPAMRRFGNTQRPRFRMGCALAPLRPASCT